MFGITGVLFSTPITEVLSAGIALLLARFEMKKLNKLIKREEKRKAN